MPSMADKLLSGAQHAFLSNRKIPPEAFVITFTGYFVRVRILHTVACVQLHLLSGYITVPLPICITTGAPIIAVDGIDCAITIQYFSRFLYDPSGIVTVSTPLSYVTAVDIINLSHNLQLLLQLIINLLSNQKRAEARPLEFPPKMGDISSRIRNRYDYTLMRSHTANKSGKPESASV